MVKCGVLFEVRTEYLSRSVRPYMVKRRIESYIVSYLREQI
jgi:hypothetical protein